MEQPVLLIVDDEPPIRRLVTRIAGSIGFTVCEADDGQKGLEKAREVKPDVVLTDLKMPNMDGLAMATQLLEEDPDRPVMLVTAYADLDNAREALKLGIYDYFTKPFDVNDLSAGLKRCLKHRTLVLENKAYQENLERLVDERTTALRQKVAELGARDRLLTEMLSLQAPEETLGLAVQLALDLCDCDRGVLCLEDAGEMSPRVAVGLEGPALLTAGQALHDLSIDRDEGLRKMVAATAEGPAVGEPGTVLSGFGFECLGAMEVLKGNERLGILLVGRNGERRLTPDDLDPAVGFLPYVGLAVADVQLDATLPNLSEGDLDAVLRETEKWTNTEV